MGDGNMDLDSLAMFAFKKAGAAAPSALEPLTLPALDRVEPTAVSSDTVEPDDPESCVETSPRSCAMKRGLNARPIMSKRRRSGNRPVASTNPFVFLDPDDPTYKEAVELGMSKALHNLASRSEIMQMGFTMERLLGALREADGLVNKAKVALLDDKARPIKFHSPGLPLL